MNLYKKILLLVMLIVLSGCRINKSNMDNINIYTTTYPLNFLTRELYGEHAKIYSIYPTGINLDEYELSDRKIEEYSKSDLFIFNSLDKDRDYAVKMINLNSNLKVIDVATGMSFDSSIEELWLNPNNYLMMAENIKDGLTEYIDNPYLVEEIDKNYEELEYDISKLDAHLTETIINANYNTIIVDNDIFKYLEKRGLKVISLEENNDLTSNKIEEAEKLISDGNVKYIYSSSNTSNNTVNSLLNKYKIDLIEINTMHKVDGGITNSNDNYLTVMTNNINLIKKELYK